MPAPKKTSASLHHGWESLCYALGVVVYVVLVALVFRYADRLFGPNEPMVGMIAFLLLFVLSATIVGLLVLGKPVLLYVEGQKKEGIRMLLCTIGWLVLTLVLLLAGLCLYMPKV